MTKRLAVLLPLVVLGALALVLSLEIVPLPPAGTVEASPNGDGSSCTLMTTGTTNHLYDVWGSSSSDVFAVGSYGTVLHYDGNSWAPMSSGTTNHLLSVWGSSSTDVFAVGSDGTVLHYDGSSWTPMDIYTTSPLLGIWGSCSCDVFAVGWGWGTVFHYDGRSWTRLAKHVIFDWLRDLTNVWGSCSCDVFAVGPSGTIHHYDGSCWSDMVSYTTNGLYDVWGSSSSDVFAVGSYGTILHYDGSSWARMTSGTTHSLVSVWGSSSTDVFAVGDNGTIVYYDGSSWIPMSSGSTYDLYGVWGSSSTDVFAVGSDGTILHLLSVAHLPDLSFEKVGFDVPELFEEGDVIHFGATVVNQGDEDAHDFWVEVYLDERLNDSQTVSLMAGQSVTLWSENPWTATGGSHILEWRVDTTNVVAESDENNNQMNRIIVPTVASSPSGWMGVAIALGVVVVGLVVYIGVSRRKRAAGQ